MMVLVETGLVPAIQDGLELSALYAIRDIMDRLVNMLVLLVVLLMETVLRDFMEMVLV